MKNVVVYQYYMPIHETKDQGLITLGLNRLGFPTTLITLSKAELSGHKPPFPIISTTQRNLEDTKFWQGIDADIAICYTMLSPTRNALVAAIRSSGKKIILKTDGDGRLGYPVIDLSYQYYMPIEPSFIQRIVVNPIGMYYFKLRCQRRAQQIRMADAVIIETPMALENVKKYFRHWEKADVLPKFHVIPNPVSDDVSTSDIRGKREIVVAVGRWDVRQKNASLMLKCLKEFLAENPGWRARVVATMGRGKSLLVKVTSGWSTELRKRVEILGPLNSHHMIVEILESARIFFMPSRYEGLPIAASEAVCMGCTVVGTPLESLHFLTANGFSGTLSRSFDAKDISDALRIDSAKHEQSVYDAHEIAEYWRGNLSEEKISSQICGLFNEI